MRRVLGWLALLVGCTAAREAAPGDADPLLACQRALDRRVAAGELVAPVTCTLVHAPVHASSGNLRGAALVEVSDSENDGYDGHELMVVLAGPRGYDQVLPFLYVSEGMNELLDFAVTRVALEDVLPGGSHELRVEMRSKSDSHDCEGIDTYLTVRSDFGLCGLDADGAGYCVSPLPRTQRSVIRNEQGQVSVQRDFALAYRGAEQALEVRLAQGSLPETLTGLVSRHELGKAAKLPGVEGAL